MEKKEHIKSLLDRWRFAPPKDQEPPKTESVWRTLYSYWMKFARLLGKVNTTLLLTLSYVLILGPVAMVLKLFGKDLLDRKAEHRASYWYDKPKEPITQEQSKHQF